MPVFQLTESIIFPPPELARSDGLLAVGGDLSEARLLLAYEQGIFPWYSPGEPILWWAPSPRLVLEPKKFRISKKLAGEIRKGTFKVTMDLAFSDVITECADIRVERDEGTWITNEMKNAYVRLHELGYAHSVECWQEGKLAGGLYGVSLGTVFFGESMFSRVSNSSKVALATLARILTEWKFDMIDCQITTSHLMGLGAQQINGREFYTRLQKYTKLPTRRGKWRL
ncbi:MAG: leucyl/phenylalanyl-tRNA--protein transferase [Thermodesulfobacteriota bacterium]|nr:leucyl/phenylalanyl-tRNA--protein transferase [Thermodesulfobacteriota bacterium]